MPWGRKEEVSGEKGGGRVGKLHQDQNPGSLPLPLPAVPVCPAAVLQLLEEMTKDALAQKIQF